MKRIVTLCLTLLLLLMGCAKQPAQEGLQLWFITDPAGGLGSAAAMGTCPYEGEETVPQLMAALLAGPYMGSGLVSPFPADTRLLGWSQEGDILELDFSGAYGELVGMDLTLADYCITLTMTQLADVEGVRITVNGGGVPYRDRQILYAHDVVFSGAEEEPVELSAALHFRRTGTAELGYELRSFRLTEHESPALVVLEALAEGPQDEGLEPLLPEGVEVYSARVDGGVCHADFSAALLDNIPQAESDRRLLIQSLVDTLCSIDSVESVQIMVEGETVSRYGGVDISQPLSPTDGHS